MLNVLTDATPLESLFENVGTIITNILSSFSTISSGLMSNEIFQLVVGIVIFGIIIGIIYTLVRKLRRRGN